ncbi:putative ribonuclease H-like domain-containing protein [Tanacetum coccineum]|uniref:Ribonuclease H-like domain-containing protein n=1 Tax=Tanacetum coccineum TaxID=301880 RepID=A0ABQ5I6Y9_9ASTR
MSEPMPTIPTQSPFTYPNPNSSASPSFTQDDTFMPNPSASPSFTQDDTFMPNMPEPIQPMPTFTQTAFSQPAVHTQHTHPAQTNSTGQQYPNNVQSQQFQQFQTATISANNAKFPYLEKEKYEIWAMKMEYWIQNADHNLWRIVQQGNSPKRLGKDAKGNTIVHPPVSLDEHVAVQRENKDIWMAVNAGLVGIEEIKEVKKTCIKQQFAEFSVTEEEGLHKGYDRFQKILSQLNQVQARPDNDDINLKFLRALPSSWSQVALALKTRGGLESMSFDDRITTLRSLELMIRIGYRVMCNVKTVDDKARYSAFKVTEVKTDEPKALVFVNSMVNWSDHAAENKTGEVEKVNGMMAGLHANNGGAGISNAANEFAMMGISPKNTLTTGAITETLHDQAQKEKKEWEVNCLFSDPVGEGVKPLYSKVCQGWGNACCSSSYKTGTYMPAHSFEIEEHSGTSLQNQKTHTSCDSWPSRTKTKRLPTCCCISRLCQGICPCKSKAASVPAGSKNSPASVTAGGSDPAASRNRPAVNSADRPHPAGRSKRPATVSAGRPVSAGGGDGRISGKGTIRTSKLDFENVYYVEELYHKSVIKRTKFSSQTLIVWCFQKNSISLHESSGNSVGKRELRGIIVIPEPHSRQNGVAERKNRTLIEAARTMLADSKLPTMFWTEAVSTACYVLNRVSITNPHNKTPYELISGKVPQIGHLKPFGCQVTILNTSDHLGKFEGKADEGYLVGYATNSKAYRVYNLTNKRVEETMNLRFLEDKPNVQGIGHEWYFDLDYLTDSLGYTRFKTDKPAGTQETNINAGTQDHDSDSEVDEQVIVVPSFPSNSFAAKDAAARYSYLFSQETAKILSQAEAKIQNQGVSADRDPAGIDSAGGVSAGSASTGSGNPAISTSVSADFIPVHADESTLPPGQSLGSSENTTRFPVPSDVCKDQLSSGIFTSSSYDDDFSATLTNLAPAVEVNPVPTKRVNTIHPQSQILGDLASPVLTRSRAQKSKFGESAFIGYIQDQQRTNHTDQLHCLFACFLSQLEPTSIAKALEDPDWVAAMQEEMQQFINQQVWKLVPLPDGKHAIGTKWILKNKRDARGIVVRNKASWTLRVPFSMEKLKKKCMSLSLKASKALKDPYFSKACIQSGVRSLYSELSSSNTLSLVLDKELSAFLLQHNYRRGTIRTRHCSTEKIPKEILLDTVYVDESPNILGTTNKAWCDDFEVLMKGEFEMSAMGEMNFFLGLQVKQLPDVSKSATKIKACGTLKISSPLSLEAYSDSDYAGFSWG